MLEWLERNRSNLASFLVVLVAVAAVALLQTPRRSALQVVSPSVPSTPAPIKVHVVGAVTSPGVYSLPADARVEDALKAAGGPSGSADMDAVNLAAPLRDGQQLSIPTADARDGAARDAMKPAASPVPARLDLNVATRQQLEALPGVGQVTAQKILDYRASNGRFVSVDELRDAKLVNGSTFERIKGLVEVR